MPEADLFRSASRIKRTSQFVLIREIRVGLITAKAPRERHPTQRVALFWPSSVAKQELEDKEEIQSEQTKNPIL